MESPSSRSKNTIGLLEKIIEELHTLSLMVSPAEAQGIARAHEVVAAHIQYHDSIARPIMWSAWLAYISAVDSKTSFIQISFPA